MITRLALIPLLWAAAADPERIVDLKVDGMGGRETFVAVDRAFRAIPGVRSVDFFVSAGETQTHLVVGRGAVVELEQVEKALEAARADLKEKLQKEIPLALDEEDVRLPEGNAYHDAEGAVRKIANPISLAAFRRDVKGFSRLALPLDEHVSGLFACPSGCAGSNRDGDCPKCGQAFHKVDVEQPPSG